MGQDGLTDLDPTHVLFRNVAHYITGVDSFAVGKSYTTTNGVDLRDDKSLVLLHLLRNIEQIIAHTQDTSFAVNALIVANFQLQFSHRGLLAGQNNLL